MPTAVLLPRASIVLLASVALACSSSSSKPAGTGSSLDASVDASIPATTPGTTVGTCMPSMGFGGNSLHVGAFCSANGGQCSNYDNGTSLLCSIDVAPAGAPPGSFCVLLCTSDSDCGEDGCCTGQTATSPKACVPNGCFDGGVCSPIAP